MTFLCKKGAAYLLTSEGAALTATTFALWGWALGVNVAITLIISGIGFLGLSLAARLFRLSGRLQYVIAQSFLGVPKKADLKQKVSELTADRKAVLEAVASERKRIERNLHDGVQQQLVAAGIDIGLASQILESDTDKARPLLDDALVKLQGSIGELRALGRGLHPAILDGRGLEAALQSFTNQKSYRLHW